MKLKAGDLFPTKTLRAVSGKELHVPDSGSLTHLQFRRFVGCPICNTHIGQMMKRAEEIKSAGIHEVIFFHSREEEMQPLQQGVPFDLVADAEKVYYKEFGVEDSEPQGDCRGRSRDIARKPLFEDDRRAAGAACGLSDRAEWASAGSEIWPACLRSVVSR